MVLGLAYVAYIQAEFDQSTREYCQNFDSEKPQEAKQFIFDNIISEDLQPLIETCVFGENDFSLDKLMKFDDYIKVMTDLESSVAAFEKIKTPNSLSRVLQYQTEVLRDSAAEPWKI